jgi:hypothetical protein
MAVIQVGRVGVGNTAMAKALQQSTTNNSSALLVLDITIVMLHEGENILLPGFRIWTCKANLTGINC